MPDEARSGLSVASSNIHSQRFDDEVVVIDTKSGIYSSLRGAAVDIWELVLARQSRDAMTAVLAARYDGSPAAIAAALDHCLDDLIASGLIRQSMPAEPLEITPAVNGARVKFPEPLIEHFTDMQDLLLLDPIHEVTDEGWPLARPAQEA